MNSTGSRSLPEDVRNLILRKLRHQRRQYEGRLIGVTSRAYNKLRKEILANLQAGKPGKALVSVPLDVYREIANGMTAITKEWPGLVWQTIVTILEQGKVAVSDSTELNAFVDEFSWAAGQQPFTIGSMNPEQFKDLVFREVGGFGAARNDFTASFERQLSLTAAAVKSDIFNTARVVREEIAIAIEEYVVLKCHSAADNFANTKAPDTTILSEPQERSMTSGYGKCLPNPPKKKNDWFLAIQDMASAFYDEYGRWPSAVEAWSRLQNNPPKSYGIRPDEHNGEPAVYMGSKPMGKSTFRGRWRRYTGANKDNKR